MLQSFIKSDFIHRQLGLFYIILIEYNLTMPHLISIPMGMGGMGVYVKFNIDGLDFLCGFFIESCTPKV